MNLIVGQHLPYIIPQPLLLSVEVQVMRYHVAPYSHLSLLVLTTPLVAVRKQSQRNPSTLQLSSLRAITETQLLNVHNSTLI